MKDQNHTEELKKHKAAQTNRALGIFILFFGVVVLVAIFFTDTSMGKLTNAMAGGLLCLIGLVMVLMSNYTIKRIQKKTP